MSMNDFKMGNIIGKGAFGSVLIVTRKKDDKRYAMKRVNIGKLNKKERESSLNEIRILASLSHPNIIGYKEAFFDQSTNTLNIVMEFADEGDLEKKIKNNLKKRLYFEENTIWKWIIQLLQGIKYLHDNRIMHRDLKCANIFLMKNGLLKLGDLNVSKFAKLGMASTQTGTPYYCSPEIWKEKSYDYKSDIWSLGCIIYEICSLRPPFRGTSLKALRNNVLNGHYLPIPSIYSDDLSILISKMLVIDPSKRASAKDLLKDEIIVNKIRNLKKIYNNDIKNEYNQEKANLIKTIRFPLNIKEINSKLPKKRYNPEEEMMENDEYETMKQTFFQNLKEQEKKEEKKSKNNINGNGNKHIYNKHLNNYIKDNKDIVHHNNNKNAEKNNNNQIKFKQIEKNINKNNYIRRKQKENSMNKKNNHSIESRKSNDYLFNKDFNYRYEKALNNNHKLKKFYTKKTNFEKRNIQEKIFKNQESNPKSVLNYNYLNNNNNHKLFKNKSDDNNLKLNINNNHINKSKKNIMYISPYKIIINNEDNDIIDNNFYNNNKININKKSRYRHLFSEDTERNDNKSSEVKILKNYPQSALQRKNKFNLKIDEFNNKRNKSKNRPRTSMPNNHYTNEQNNLKGNQKGRKKNSIITNLYDKYKNKNTKQLKYNLYGFKYVPQKRQIHKIIYGKIDYNDYCRKNKIDKYKNFHYYRENGYYNYRNAMKKYGNYVHIRNSAKKSNDNSIQNHNIYDNFLKNEYKGGGGAGYAARIRKQRNNK